MGHKGRTVEQLVQLHPGLDVLNGYQSGVYDSIVCAIMRGIEAGDEFPPVPVIEEHGEYSLCDFRRKDLLGNSQIDGGHHRAVAHYLAEAPLSCHIVGQEYTHRDAQSGAVLGASIVIPDEIEFWADTSLEKYDENKSFWGEYRQPCRRSKNGCPLQRLGFDVCKRF